MTPRDRPFVSFLFRAVLVLGVTSLPYVYAAWWAPAAKVYVGLMTDVPDHAQYWAWVTASERALFISNTLTPEVNPPVFMNAWMFVLAQVRRLFALSFPALFQVWRVAAVTLLIGAMCAFARTVAVSRRLRSLVFWLALLGSGFGWAMVVAKKVAGLGDVPFPSDVYLFETNSFWAALSYPYVVLAQALIVWTFVGVLWSERDGRTRWRGVAMAITGALCVALFHAYDLITIYVVLAVFGLAEWVRQRTFPWRVVLLTAAVGAVSGPIAIYYRLLTLHDPLWQAILAQYENAGIVTPPGWHLLVLLGVPLLLAPFGVRRLDGELLPRFILVWAVVGGVIAYLPTVYQVKFLTAWQFPLAVLAARAWTRWTAGWRSTAEDRGGERGSAGVAEWAPALVILLLVVPTNAYLFAWRFVELRRHERPYFLERDEVAAFDWLSTHATPADVVIAPLDIGQYVPSYGRTRSYLAHWAMTNRFFERQRGVAQFFDPAIAGDVKREILDRDAVTLVLATRTEPLGQGTEPCPTWLEPVFSQGSVRLFRYRRDAPSRIASVTP